MADAAVAEKEVVQEAAVETNGEANKVTITRDQAMGLFNWCGWKTASKWTNERMGEKLKQVPEMKPEDDPKDENVAATLLTLLDAFEKGNEVVVTGDGASEGKAAKGEKKVKEPKAKKEKPPKKETKNKMFCAGQVVKEFGVGLDINAAVARLNEVYGDANDNTSLACLKAAVAAIKGYGIES